MADGMGGAIAGEEASRLAASALVEAFEASQGDAASLLPAAERAAQAVYAAAQQPGRGGMGTTLTAALLEGMRLAIVHAGDCRPYLGREGSLRSLTTDHTWVAELVRTGAMTSAQAHGFAFKNVLTRALGRNPTAQFDTVQLDLQPGDRLLLCCDGLYRVVREEQLAQAVFGRSPQQAADALVRLANDAGGEDNVTAIVVAV